MKLLVSTRGPCWAVAGQDRHFASQPHGVELNHPCGLTVDGTSPSASMCPSPSRVRLRQRTAPSRSEDALIRGGHPGTRCMTRLTVTGNECRRRVVRMTYEACTYPANAAVVFKCTWPGCLEIKATVALIEEHVRQSHLGPKKSNGYDNEEDDDISDHEEEFYYQEVAVDHMSSPPTMSHRDMARPPHEDPEYQKQLRLEATPVINNTENMMVGIRERNTAFISQSPVRVGVYSFGLV
ncbi:hypothetical protein WN48_09877 [Eufriesea mexicana]|nr:hypothetical protein WN48_09877 [Eufriesea mexicana]